MKNCIFAMVWYNWRQKSQMKTIVALAQLWGPQVMSRTIKSWCSETGNFLTEAESISNLVRRHSLSLHNRTPPKDSLVEQLLNSPRIGFQKTDDLIKDVRAMTDRLSEFGSCISFDLSSNEDSNEEKDKIDGFRVLEKKRNKRNKRNDKMTPEKNNFLKKPNSINWY